MAFPIFEGIMTPIVTPFDSRGEVDYDDLGRHIDFLLANGIHWLIPGGSTGEYYAMTLEERKRQLAFVVERTRGRVRLAAGTNSVRPADTLELNAYVKDLGYEAIMMASPFYSLPTTGELIHHFRRVAAATPLPIILYNFPARTGVDMNPAFLEGVKDVPNIIAIKESAGSFARTLEHILHFPNLQRLCGNDDQALDVFLWGSRAWLAGGSNCIPAEHVALYKAAVVKKDFILGQRIMAGMLPLLSHLESCGKFLQCVKYGTELTGLKRGDPRPPLLPLDEAEKKHFRGLFDQLRSANLPGLTG